jgi:hypothetical protein
VDGCDVVTRDPSYVDGDRNLQENPADAFILDDRVHASADYILKYSWISGNVAVRELADHAPINYVEALK